MNNRIIIILLLGFCCTIASAQKSVSGRVTDTLDGLPLPGVTVLLKGTIHGTSTDSLGRYSLRVPESGGILIFHFLGYDTQEINILGHQTINVMLEQTTDPVEIIMMCSPTDHIKLKLLSGTQYTHYGFAGELRLAGLASPFDNGWIPLRIKTSFQHQFFKGNSRSTFRIGRFDNFEVFNTYINSELEYATRKIQLGDGFQELNEIALVNTAKTIYGRIGLGAGIQTQRLEAQSERSVALVAEWQKTLLEGFTPGVQIKKWQNTSQVRWNLDYSMWNTGIHLSIEGIHFQDYNELSLGMAYRVNL